MISSDPSTVGAPKYERKELDFYPTPREVTEAILPYLPGNRTIWEPCVGDGAITAVLSERWEVRGSDIHNYLDDPLFGPVDFLKDNWDDKVVCIVTNPPYDKSHAFVKRALELRHVFSCFFLLRHEWDASQKSLPLVSHPSFKCKYVLKKRPRWIPESKVAPRFPYAWYEWQKGFTGTPTTVYGVE